MASVDVVIPCYNYARYLGQCVASVLGQQGVDVRALIIDDASTDDSFDRGSELASLHPLVSIHRHAKNLGHIATYNEGVLEWAEADYTLLLSADDLLTPGALARATLVMERHGDVGLTYGAALVARDDQELPTISVSAEHRYCVIDGATFLKRTFEHGNPVPTPTAVVRTIIQKRIGGYSAELPHSGDVEMWMRFASQGTVGIVKANQALYRVHAKNMSAGYYARAVGDRREQLAACRRIHDSCSGRFPSLRELLDGTAKRLTSEALWLASEALDRGDSLSAEACIALAEELCTGELASNRWWKLRLKRAIGADAWKRLSPWLNRLRGSGVRNSRDYSCNRASNGKQIGWCPDMDYCLFDGSLRLQNTTMNANPLISVVIPTFNSARYVAEAIKSALRQTYTPIEVIVIDDGSTDDTRACMEEEDLIRQVRYFRQENLGVAAARNRGIDVAYGELIAFLDADDQWLPEKLHKQWRALKAQPQAALIHSDLLHLREPHGELEHKPRDRGRFSGHCYRELFKGNSVVPSTVVVTRRCLKHVGVFDESIRRGASTEDMDLWLRIARHASFAYVDEPLVLYREHSNNATLNRRTMLEDEYYVLSKALRRDPQLSRDLGQQAVRPRMSDLAFGAGYANIDAGQLRRARHYFGLALRAAPWRLANWVFWGTTYLPLGLHRSLRSTKQRLSASISMFRRLDSTIAPSTLPIPVTGPAVSRIAPQTSARSTRQCGNEKSSPRESHLTDSPESLDKNSDAGRTCKRRAEIWDTNNEKL